MIKLALVKNIIKLPVPKDNRYEGEKHRKVFRPWGNYTSVEQGSRWQVKRIEVKPKGSLEDIPKFHELLEDVICSDNDSWSKYLWSWLAHIIQKPYEKPSVAIVLRSGPIVEVSDSTASALIVPLASSLSHTCRS